jgi:hypothetical protein
MAFATSMALEASRKCMGFLSYSMGNQVCPCMVFMVAVLAKRKILHRLVAEDFSSNVNGNDFLSQRRQ